MVIDNIVELFQNCGPSWFEDRYEGWIWEIKGEGGVLAATVFPVEPMWEQWANHSKSAWDLGMAEWSISLFVGIMPPEFYGEDVPR